jgi:hypothetical protein
VEDPGLRAVWDEVRQFYTEPSGAPKRPADLFKELREPPFGVRQGVLPILFAAGLKAFPAAISLTREGDYITDILPSVVEDLCKNPDGYRIHVLDLDDTKLKYLRRLHRTFSSVSTFQVPENDLIRMCFDAIESWKAQLPPAALSARQVSKATGELQRLLRQYIEPVRLLMEEIPRACGCDVSNPKKLFRVLNRCITELLDVTRLYCERAATTVRSALSFGGLEEHATARDTAMRWAMCFPGRFVESIADSVAKGLLSTLRSEFDSDERLFDSLSQLILGKPISRWDDATIAVFDHRFNGLIREIEGIALSSNPRFEESGPATKGLEDLAAGRMAKWLAWLVDSRGAERAGEVLGGICKRELGTDKWLQSIKL